MKDLITRGYGNYTIHFASVPVDPSTLINAIGRAETLSGKGRGGIRLVEVDGLRLACRKYVHGGLFRAVTRGLFLSARRAFDEMAVTLYLKEKGFPVVEPFCIIVEKQALALNLYLLTVFEEGALDLMEFLNKATGKDRFRIILRFAHTMFRLRELGVFHPDLHLRNVLVTRRQELLFLDFDKAFRTPVSDGVMERMFWRLNRYIEKMERKGYLQLPTREKVFFLRVYGKLANSDTVAAMEKKLKGKRLTQRIGWFIESLLYGNDKKPGG